MARYCELQDNKEFSYAFLGMGDFDEVMYLIKNCYVPYEPEGLGLGITFEEQKDRLECLAKKYLEKGISVCAKNKAGEVIGITLVDIKPVDTEALLEQSVTCTEGNVKLLRRHEISAYLAKTANIESKHSPNEQVLYTSRMTVHPKYRRRGIPRKMLEIAEQNGVKKGIQFSYAIATGIGSQKNLQRHGYVTVCEVPYRIFDFLNLEVMGNNISIKVMSKKLF